MKTNMKKKNGNENEKRKQKCWWSVVVGALVVVEENKVVGIITERDYARKIVLQNKSSRETPVSEIMTERVIYVHPEQTIEECMVLMTEKHVRHLPVLDGNRLCGMVSIGDVVKCTHLQ